MVRPSSPIGGDLTTQGRVPSHPRSGVHRLQRSPERNRKRDGQDCWQQQGHQQATDKLEDLLSPRAQLDVGGLAGVDQGIAVLPCSKKLTLQVPIGDQPTDIEKQTRTLISEYIAKPNRFVVRIKK